MNGIPQDAKENTDQSHSFSNLPGQFGSSAADQNLRSSPIESSPQAQETLQEPDYEPHEIVVKPYAVEEPEDEPAAPSPLFTAFREIEDNGETSQGDLIDSMEGLHCDSDNDPRINIKFKRGKKRKPPTAAMGSSYAHPQEHRTTTDGQYGGSTLSPKRLRRRSKRSRENLRGTPADSTRYSKFKGQESSESVSPSSNTTEASSVQTADGSTEADSMEID
ncbi:hypothetical protein BJX96DRAFT_61721 [Aspergillus floccosus]